MKKKYIAFTILISLFLFSCRNIIKSEYETRLYSIRLKKVSKIKEPLKLFFKNKGAKFSDDGKFVLDKDISTIIMTDTKTNLKILEKILEKEKIILHSISIIGMCSTTDYESPFSWSYAFETEEPEDIEIVHSIYNARFIPSDKYIIMSKKYERIRSSREFFFQIEKNTRFMNELLSEPGIVKVDKVEDDTFSIVPDWFLPKNIKLYDIYTNRSLKYDYFIFIDKETKRIFLYKYSYKKFKENKAVSADG